MKKKNKVICSGDIDFFEGGDFTVDPDNQKKFLKYLNTLEGIRKKYWLRHLKKNPTINELTIMKKNLQSEIKSVTAQIQELKNKKRGRKNEE